MTVGQRIAQKRKELGLSQEALGEKLGVSRQSIYKWESDTVLPEVEKLVALSRLFSVPVGWLLGVEDAAPETSEAAPELTDAQLAMVKEIVEQYLTAREEVKPNPWRRRLRTAGVLLMVAVVGALAYLVVQFNRMSEESQAENQDLRSYVDEMWYSLTGTIADVTEQMEDSFRENSSVAVDWQVEHLSSDPEAGTASFRVQATPRTYTPETTALFRAVSMGETVELAVAEPGEGNAFSGEITCPLTDDITLSVVFRDGQTEQIQVLEEYDRLYTDTFPYIQFSWEISFVITDGEDGVLSAQPANQGLTAQLEWPDFSLDDEAWEEALRQQAQPLQVGLFRDNELLLWYELSIAQPYVPEGANPENYPQAERAYWIRPEEVVMEPGHKYTEACIYTDELGRRLVHPLATLTYYEDSERWVRSVLDLPGNPEAWVF